MMAILTKYSGNAKTGGGKIVASDGKARRIEVEFAHELGYEERRRAAAMALLEKYEGAPSTNGEWVAGDLTGEWDLVFVFKPTQVTANSPADLADTTLLGLDLSQGYKVTLRLPAEDVRRETFARSVLCGRRAEKDGTGRYVDPQWERDRRYRKYLTDLEVTVATETPKQAHQRIMREALVASLAILGEPEHLANYSE